MMEVFDCSFYLFYGKMDGVSTRSWYNLNVFSMVFLKVYIYMCFFYSQMPEMYNPINICVLFIFRNYWLCDGELGTQWIPSTPLHKPLDETSVVSGNNQLGLLGCHGFRFMIFDHDLLLRLENRLLAFNLGARNSFSKVFTKKNITIFLIYAIVLLYTIWYNNHSIFRKETINMDLIASFLKVMSNNEYNYFKKKSQLFFRYVKQITYDIIKETSLPLIKRQRAVFLRILMEEYKHKHMIYTILLLHFMYTYPLILQEIKKGSMSHFLWKCEIHPFSVLMFTSVLTQQNLNMPLTHLKLSFKNRTILLNLSTWR